MAGSNSLLDILGEDHGADSIRQLVTDDLDHRLGFDDRGAVVGGNVAVTDGILDNHDIVAELEAGAGGTGDADCGQRGSAKATE